MSAVARLRELVEAEGPPLADSLKRDSQPVEAVFDDLARKGSRSSRNAAQCGLAIEAVLEGFLVHYGTGRVVVPIDSDMRLLAGDYLYALGFLELARLGDDQAIEDLARLIASCAAAGSDEREAAGVEGLWLSTVLAVTDGHWEGFVSAGTAQAAGPGRGNEKRLDMASARAAQRGLTLEMEAALIAFRTAVRGHRPTS